MRIDSVRGSPTDSGFGWITHGWRPISVKIQPEEFARKGKGIAARQPQEKMVAHLPFGRRPLRVNSQAKKARAREPTISPIMARKDQ